MYYNDFLFTHNMVYHWHQFWVFSTNVIVVIFCNLLLCWCSFFVCEPSIYQWITLNWPVDLICCHVLQSNANYLSLAYQPRGKFVMENFFTTGVSPYFVQFLGNSITFLAVCMCTDTARIMYVDASYLGETILWIIVLIQVLPLKIICLWHK